MEAKFEHVEKSKFDYIRNIRSIKEKEMSLVKIEEETISKEKLLGEKQQILNIRNLNEKLFQQEVKTLNTTKYNE